MAGVTSLRAWTGGSETVSRSGTALLINPRRALWWIGKRCGVMKRGHRVEAAQPRATGKAGAPVCSWQPRDRRSCLMRPGHTRLILRQRCSSIPM